MTNEQIAYYRKYQLNPTDSNECYKFFLKEYHLFTNPNVLELGCLRWGPLETHWKDKLNGWGSYTRTDIKMGQDVDVVADAHHLSEVFSNMDVVIARSLFEHLHSPWKAAEEILKVLNTGGLFYIQTHFVFVEHGYPDDFFRFTKNGLKRLFEQATTVFSCYDYPCKIVQETQNNQGYLNVCVSGIK